MWSDTGVYIFLLFLFAGFLCTIWVIGRAIHAGILFQRKDKNPYRRHCRKCGQCQEVYTFWIQGYDNSWWEDMGPVADEDCVCHSFSTYRSLI